MVKFSNDGPGEPFAFYAGAVRESERLHEQRCVEASSRQVVQEQEFDQVDYGDVHFEDYDFDDLYYAWQDVTKGDSVLDDAAFLRDLARTLGYNSLEYFFSDNPGAVSAIEEFVMKHGHRSPEWKELLFNEILSRGGDLPEPM